MVELHTHRRSLGVGEVGNALPGLHLLVIPQSGAGGGDPPLRAHSGGLRDDEAEATCCTGTVVNQVPVIGHTVLGGHLVLTHGRHPHPVADGEATELERGEE